MYDSIPLEKTLQASMHHLLFSAEQRAAINKICLQVIKETFKALPFPKATVKGDICFTGGVDRYKQYYMQNATVQFQKTSISCNQLIVRVYHEPIEWKSSFLEYKVPRPLPLVIEQIIPSHVYKSAQRNRLSYLEDSNVDAVMASQIAVYHQFKKSVKQLDLTALLNFKFHMTFYKGEMANGIQKALTYLHKLMRHPSVPKEVRMSLIQLFCNWKRHIFQDILQNDFEPSWRCKPYRQECLELLIEDCQDKDFCVAVELCVHTLVNPDEHTLELYRLIISDLTIDIAEYRMKHKKLPTLCKVQKKAKELYRTNYFPW